MSENWYRDRVIWLFTEDGPPQFIQGQAGESEICDPLTADVVTKMFNHNEAMKHALRMQIRNCPSCKGSGMAVSGFDLITKGAAAEKTECGWCGPGRKALGEKP